MALQKQTASVDFVKGADTKTNSITNETFQEMENVVFTGDLTAKKMSGYDLISTLPENTDLSLMFKRGTDILAQTSSATYKYYQNVPGFKKISDIGSAYIEEVEAPGSIFVAGTNYNAYFKTFYTANDSTGTFNLGTIYGSWTFTDKSGAVLNTIVLNLSPNNVAVIEPYWDAYNKGVAIGDKFYFSGATLDGNTLGLKYFSYDLTSNAFQFTNDYVFSTIAGNQEVDISSFSVGTASLLLAFDMIADGASLFVAIKANSGNKFYKFPSTLGTPTIATIAESITTNLELHDSSTTNILMSAATVSGTTSTLKLRIYLKSTLAFVSEVTLGTQSINSGSIISECAWSTYPLSTTTAVFFPFLTSVALTSNFINVLLFVGYSSMRKGASVLNGVLIDGLIPIGKTFLYNGKYYAHFMQVLGEERTNLIVDVQTGAPRAIFGISPLVVEIGPTFNQLSARKLYSTSSTLDAFGNPTYVVPGFYPLQEQYLDNGKYIFPTFSDSGATHRGEFTFQTYKNTAIEVGQKAFIQGPVPCQFDGSTLTENDLIGAPFLSFSSVGSGGLLLASNYQLVAIYEWKDASGITYRSRISNVLGGDSTAPIAVAAGQKIVLNIYCPIITQRSNVLCKVYLKKTTDTAFKICYSFPVRMSNSNINTASLIEIAYNPIATSEVLYTQGVGINESQKEYFPASAMSSATLYSDRIFYIKAGDNSRIYFSFTKVKTDGFGFYENSFLLECLDKRGVNEDKLTALHAMDGRLFIFKENSVLYTIGAGPSDNAENSDLVSPQLVTTDVGCTEPRSVVLTPAGLMFKSDKGIYLLDRKLQVSYIGASVERFNSDQVTSAILLENKNEVRFTLDSGYIVVFNYFSNAWSWFTDLDCVSGLVISSKYSLMDTTGQLLQESSAHNKLITTPIVQKIASPWIRGNGNQWWQKIYDLSIIGKYKSEHQIKLSVYFDYEQYAEAVYILDPLSSGNYNLTSRPTNADIESGASVDGVYQIQIDLPRKSCQAFRFVMEDVPLNTASNSGECFALASFQIVFGVKNGPAKVPNVKTY